MDALSQFLRRLRLNTRIFHRSLHCGSWVLEAQYERKAMFHLVVSGRCVMRVGAGARVLLRLERGDVVMFARPTEHLLQSDPEAVVAPDTLLLCGYFEFESPLAQRILATLPAQVVLRYADARTAGASAVLELIIAESQAAVAGSDALVNKLADALFVYVLRHCITLRASRPGLLRGLDDPRLGPALANLHERPEHAWSLERMASQAHLSRAAFARRFTSTLGVAPMAYVAEVRMQIAADALAESGATVAEAATRAGYATDSAFSRAFKRHFGYPPTQARRR